MGGRPAEIQTERQARREVREGALLSSEGGSAGAKAPRQEWAGCLRASKRLGALEEMEMGRGGQRASGGAASPRILGY